MKYVLILTLYLLASCAVARPIPYLLDSTSYAKPRPLWRTKTYRYYQRYQRHAIKKRHRIMNGYSPNYTRPAGY